MGKLSKGEGDGSSSPPAFCPSCGSQVSPSHKFCRHCGESLVGPDAAVPGRDAEPGQGDDSNNFPDEKPIPVIKAKPGGKLAVAGLAAKVGGKGGSGKRSAKQKGDDDASSSVGEADGEPSDGDGEDLSLMQRVSGQRRLLFAGGAVLAAGLVVAVLFITGVLGGGPSESETKAFRAGMASRQGLLLAELKYRDAMKTARTSLHRYSVALNAADAETKRINIANQPLYDACNSTYSNISCPDPTYPDPPKVPVVSDEVAQLRKVANTMQTLGATVRSADPDGALKPFYAQLTSAVDQLQEDATYNADTLTKGVTPPQGEGSGGVDKSALATLKREGSLASIKALNAEAVMLIKQLGLKLNEFDVPGGTDNNPDDASLTT